MCLFTLFPCLLFVCMLTMGVGCRPYCCAVCAGKNGATSQHEKYIQQNNRELEGNSTGVVMVPAQPVAIVPDAVLMRQDIGGVPQY